MKPTENIGAVITGILLNLILIGSLLWYVLKSMTRKTNDEKLLVLASTGFIILLGIFLADKLTFLNRNLLSDSESNIILLMCTSLLSAIIGYHLGTKQTPKF